MLIVLVVDGIFDEEGWWEESDCQCWLQAYMPEDDSIVDKKRTDYKVGRPFTFLPVI